MPRKLGRRLSPAVIVAVAVLVLLPPPAQAQYLDPGAGSIILQVVVAVVIGVAATLKLYWGKVTGIVSRRSRGGSKA